MDTSPDSLSFPFELTDAQVQSLNKLTAEEWLQHCQKVRANAPRTEPEVDSFLSLPIEEIVRIFQAEVQCLAASPLPSTSTTSSGSPLVLPVSSPSSPLPRCPLMMSEAQLNRFMDYSDEQFLGLARNLKQTQKWTTLSKAFLELADEIVAASIKQEVLSQCPPPNQ